MTAEISADWRVVEPDLQPFSVRFEKDFPRLSKTTPPSAEEMQRLNQEVRKTQEINREPFFSLRPMIDGWHRITSKVRSFSFVPTDYESPMK